MEEGTLLAGRYRARALLRRGGMGEVWRCLDVEQEREVAVKAVLPEFLREPWAARLFHNEVAAVARLNHPGIVPVCDLVTDEHGTYLVMEVVHGRSLADVAAGRPTWGVIRHVLEQVLGALAYAHARGVLHLDIKPDNVIVDRQEGQLHATLLDFGIARLRRIGSGIERWVDRNMVLGTIAYMAPEQCAGSVQRFGPWTDLFSVGALAFELCAGHPPFTGPPATPLEGMDRVAPPLPRMPDIPVEMIELCGRLLAPEPRDRPLLAADVLYALRGLGGADDAAADFAGAAADDVALAPTGRSAEVTRALAVARTALADTEPGLVVTTAGSPLEVPTRPARAASSTGPLPPLAATAPQHVDATEEAFTGEAAPPRPGAYGLYGLRDLPVLGRYAERRALWSAVLASVTDNRPRVVVLQGPAGVGKSRLARDAMERAVELGLAHALQTSWSADGSGDEGLRGLIENLLDTRGQSTAQVQARLSFWLERIPGLHASFVREVGLLLRPPARAAPDAGLPLRVAVEAIVRATAVRPVILWLDDVQWSRGQAEALLRALREQEGAPLPVCVICTAREDELTESGRRMAVQADTTLVRMDRLDAEATRQLVRGLLEVDDTLCDFLSSRAEGNPLFAAQLLRDLVAAGALERRGGCYRLGGQFDLDAIPPDIGALWDRRLARLRADRTHLAALALVRDRVSVEIANELIRLSDADGGAIEAAIAAALSAGLLQTEGGAYVFTHGLLRDHLVATTPAEALPRLHALAAAALGLLVGQEDVQEERARHLRAAAQPTAACEALLDAGLWSQRRAEEAPRRHRLETLAAWAKEAGEISIQARAIVELAYQEAEAGRDKAAAQGVAAAAAVAATVDVGDPVLAWVAVRHAQVLRLCGRAAEGAEVSRHAVELARRTGNREAEALLLHQLAVDHLRRGEFAEARDFAAQCQALSSALGDPHLESTALRALARTAADLSEQLRLLDQAVDVARSAGAVRYELPARQVRVDILWRLGKQEEARAELLELTAEAVRRGQRQTVSLLALQAAGWAVAAGDWDEARAQHDMAARFGAASGANVERVCLLALEMGLALWAADTDEAARLADEIDRVRAGYIDDTLRELLAGAAKLAPAPLAERLRIA